MPWRLNTAICLRKIGKFAAVEVLRSETSGAKPREHSDRRDLLWRTRNFLTRCNIHSTCQRGYTHPRKATENSLVYPKSAPALLLVKTRNSLHVFPRSTSQRATGTFATLRMTRLSLVGRGCGLAVHNPQAVCWKNCTQFFRASPYKL